MNRLWQWAETRRKSAAVVLALMVASMVLGLRAVGWLVPLEMLAWDYLIAGKAGRPDPAPIVLVGATEADLDRYGWPLPDGTLAALLRRIDKGGAAVIGVDLYRGQPVAPGVAELNAVWNDLTNVYGIYRVMAGRFQARAPETLMSNGRAGFSDLLVDPGGVTRRSLLFMEQNNENHAGFSLVLAAHYLAGLSRCLLSDGSAAGNLMFAPCPAEGEAPPSADDGTVVRPLTPDFGGYRDLDARGYQTMVTFPDSAGTYETVAFSAVLEGDPDRLRVLFEGRIVIIGVAADSVKDIFFTPFSRQGFETLFMFGMELHAHQVAQFLAFGKGTAMPTRSLGPWPTNGFVLFWCLAGVMLGLSARHMVANALAWLVAAALPVGAGYIGFLSGWWFPMAAGSIGGAASAAVAIAFLFLVENRQRKTLMSLLSRHVSKDVAEALWAERHRFLAGGKPISRRATATVLFTDLAGFTTVSESLSPSALIDWLNEYMDAMVDIVSTHGGIVDKFIGDAVMAVFGAPTPRDSEAEIDRDAHNAVSCALAMGDMIERMNARWASAGKPQIGMRVGLHTGPLVMGGLGGAKRQEFTVIGDAVNVAARLESYDKGFVDPENPSARCRVLASSDTIDRLNGAFDVAKVGEATLKGKSAPVTIFLVRPGSSTKSPGLKAGDRKE